MTTMSKESAEKIAESTVKKYENAGRKAMVILKDGHEIKTVQSLSPEEVAEIGLNLFIEIMDDESEYMLKEVAKQLKHMRKEEKKNAKRKNRA